MPSRHFSITFVENDQLWFWFSELHAELKNDLPASFGFGPLEGFASTYHDRGAVSVQEVPCTFWRKFCCSFLYITNRNLDDNELKPCTKRHPYKGKFPLAVGWYFLQNLAGIMVVSGIGCSLTGPNNVTGPANHANPGYSTHQLAIRNYISDVLFCAFSTSFKWRVLILFQMGTAG